MMSSIMHESVDNVNSSVAADSSAEDVFETIHAVMHRYRAQQYRALRGGGTDDLTHLDGKVLGFFARHPGATQKDLAAHSGRDKGQLARLIGGLKERGLLDARPDEADRRNVRLNLTNEGRSLLHVLQRRARELSERAVTNLSAEERRRLVALLIRVRENLESLDQPR